ncbi:carboxypeptidase-like regulatory domain-containing protein [Mucilaginibacter sp. UYCu711]|uniref:carboxypeptidase-like regulatory domain-containing protein n=1 Tax=Mucilaginibacter sp. UYCu711 TaxID=3156339 RepID=UPI003D2053E9
MKFIRYCLLSVFTLIIAVNAAAQGHYNVMGTVADEKGQLLTSATVFISGSEKITMTNERGEFIFHNLDPGAFQLSVTMVGFTPDIRSLVIQTSSANVNVVLKSKATELNEVKIPAGNTVEDYYQLFKAQFLGISPNGLQSEITNRDALKLNYDKKKGLLIASADEFLIIQNKRLGYKVRYLLRGFSYNAITNAAIYDGDINFEELDGTPKMKKAWEKNRLETYKGSFMHYLRSVYSNTVTKEGFITNQLFSAYNIKNDPLSLDKIAIDPRPLRYDTLATVIDTSFIALRSPDFYLTYNLKKANAKLKKAPKKNRVSTELDYNGSIIRMPFKEAIIDRKGSYTDYRAFYIHGNLARRRVGDQLPFEYQPQ